MQAEGLIQKTFIKLTGAKQVTLNEWMRAKFDIQSEIRFEIHELHLPVNKSQELNYHLDLSFLTDHTVTRPQFEAIFNNCPNHNVDYYMQEYIWKHNTQCLLFFIRGYATMLQTLEVAVDTELYHADYLDNARWLHYRLTSFHETRKFFPFCNCCPQNTKAQCSFWMDVLTHIKEAISGPCTEERAVTLRRYFEGLNNTCMIPKTLEELKQVGEV